MLVIEKCPYEWNVLLTSSMFLTKLHVIFHNVTSLCFVSCSQNIHVQKYQEIRFVKTLPLFFKLGEQTDEKCVPCEQT